MKPILFTLSLCVGLLSPGIFTHSYASDEKTSPAIATFAGGCFWCMEPPFDKLEGIISTTSGYTNGHIKNPTYKQVSAGTSGHTEAIQIVFDSERITYAKLLETFWHNIDPLDANGQFCDRGSQYRAAIFYHTPEQHQLAITSMQTLQQNEKFKQKNITTEIIKATEFYPAETYHQNYYLKNPLRYKFYRHNCGRDRVLQGYWDTGKKNIKND